MMSNNMMRGLRLGLLLMLLCLLPSAVAAQTYSVKYNGTAIGRVIDDLQRRTGYEFVYQKQTLEGVLPVTCTYNDMTLEGLLDRIFYQHAELRYEIVDKTIILRVPSADDEMPSFKRVVVGVVVDEQGEPLAGALVKLEGSQHGAVTDVDGNFSLLVEGRNPKLRFTFMGMKERVMALSSSRDETPLIVTMSESANVLAEVMVDGYSNIKRTNATGAYQTVTARELENRYTGSIVQNLEGKVPGLVTYDNGLGGSGEKAMVIRGTGTFHAASHPLVVVDGLPIEASFESVNPYEIETITVLKDAAAAAIYGARAANGVIVVTTKRAGGEKLEIDFNADITLSERQDYSNFGWASASELIELERLNFNRTKLSKSAMRSLNNAYKRNTLALSPVTGLLLQNYNGQLPLSRLNEILDSWAHNDFRRQWQDANEANQLLQQYNLSLRTRGKRLSSAIAVNYRADNRGSQREYDRALSLNYRGDLQATQWLDLGFGINLVSERSKSKLNASEWDGINGFEPYRDASQPLEAGISASLDCLGEPSLGMQPVTYSVAEEARRNFAQSRETNIRSYIHATATLLPGWTATAKFQYEDVYGKSVSLYEADSYYMRDMYNRYTTRAKDGTVTHHVPYGGRRDQSEAEGAYYTFRAQSDYGHTFAQRHELNANVGFEYRESQLRTSRSTMLGYDHQTQTNANGLVNFRDLTLMSGQASVMGSDYAMVGAPTGDAFGSTDVLNRFYSVYATAGYTYDTRYAATLSYRVDRTNLFGADPEFRGRPLWSAGLSWNAHNEAFLKDSRWVDMLKLRASYGLTGNIAQNFSSYLTASIIVNELTGDKQATLDMPPNDQLRWEKTASFNFGADFVLWHGRLAGTFDAYTRHGSDILTTTDLDPTTGWSQLTINNGKVVNRGAELSLTGAILKPRQHRGWGLNATVNYSYNHNRVTAVSHLPQSGYEALSAYTLHQGRPVHSVYSYDYAGLESKGDLQYFTWRDHEGRVHNSDISTDDFTVADAVYCGSLDPKHVLGFTPEVTWRGLSLSAMLSFYGGHAMRARVERWSGEGSMYGYDGLSEIEAVPSSYLDYWHSGDATQYVANGYMGNTNIVGDYHYMSANVVKADYLKLRNIVLSYQLPKQWCRKMQVEDVRLRLQMNNVATWVRNPLGVDPEANSPSSGDTQKRTPRSYTMSVAITL